MSHSSIVICTALLLLATLGCSRVDPAAEKLLADYESFCVSVEREAKQRGAVPAARVSEWEVENGSLRRGANKLQSEKAWPADQEKRLAALERRCDDAIREANSAAVTEYLGALEKYVVAYEKAGNASEEAEASLDKQAAELASMKSRLGIRERATEAQLEREMDGWTRIARARNERAEAALWSR